MERSVSPCARRCHPAPRRETIENMPGCVYPHDIAVIEFRSDQGIALAVYFVTSKSLHARTRLASVEDQLLVLNLNICFSRADFRAVYVGIRETFTQIRVVRMILQLTDRLEARWLRAGARVDADQLS